MQAQLAVYILTGAEPTKTDFTRDVDERDTESNHFFPPSQGFYVFRSQVYKSGGGGHLFEKRRIDRNTRQIEEKKKRKRKRKGNQSLEIRFRYNSYLFFARKKEKT